ncbi:hypothetical protein MKX01_021013 [Papaver californicum]|nr:hypothetical protein MKX01_021013 [Papaver californicum]
MEETNYNIFALNIYWGLTGFLFVLMVNVKNNTQRVREFDCHCNMVLENTGKNKKNAHSVKDRFISKMFL